MEGLLPTATKDSKGLMSAFDKATRLQYMALAEGYQLLKFKKQGIYERGAAIVAGANDWGVPFLFLLGVLGWESFSVRAVINSSTIQFYEKDGSLYMYTTNANGGHPVNIFMAADMTFEIISKGTPDVIDESFVKITPK